MRVSARIASKMKCQQASVRKLQAMTWKLASKHAACEQPMAKMQKFSIRTVALGIVTFIVGL